MACMNLSSDVSKLPPQLADLLPLLLATAAAYILSVVAASQ